MIRPGTAASLLGLVSWLAFEGFARAQLPAPQERAQLPRSADNSGAGLRGRFGAARASQLMRSLDPDERLRGVERAAALRTPEGLALLELAATPRGPEDLDPRLPAEGVARTDPRALLAAVRGLAAWSAEDHSARAALASILAAPAASFATPPALGAGVSASPVPDRIARADESGEAAARVVLARRIAALALAETDDATAIEALVATARGGGPGQEAAIRALAAAPPSSARAFGGVALTTPAMTAVAAADGDLRAIDPISGPILSSDAKLRAASVAALGVDGDVRDAGLARHALTDPDPRVRAAAASALVRLGAPDADRAVESLIGDDMTAADGLALAQLVQSEGVTRALAARAIASSDGATRAAALSALGRQTGPSAVRTLELLVADPSSGSDAACALAHSPNASALAALEALAGRPNERRLAARAYFVRRYTRGERSASLDKLLVDLSRSADPRDRAVGVQARASLGDVAVGSGLDDPSPSVRRAAAMAAVARWTDGARAALLARRRVEPDAATRTVLGIGLFDGDPGAEVASTELVTIARGGGADAPLAVIALAARTADSPEFSVDPYLASPDPVVRAHAARGLGRNAAPEALGKLARMYAWEADAEVRRAIVAALGARSDSGASAAHAVLQVAARLDPDQATRWIAARALAHRRFALRSVRREVAWIHLAAAESARVPADETAMFVESDGAAIPIAFDDEGYALVPGVRSGQSRLRLAPRLPPYSAPGP